MTFLLLAILMNIAIFVLFRIFPQLNINRFQAIVINYVVCVITGISLTGLSAFSSVTLQEPWIPFSVALGFIFIGTFYSMALTTEFFSITVSSVASKISLAIPVLFALFIFDIESKQFDIWNYLGLILSVVAIYLSSSSQKMSYTGKAGWYFFLPVIVFIMGGIIDTMINFVSFKYLSPEDVSIFPVFIFMTAATIGIVALTLKKTRLTIRNIMGGIILGVVNYFSVYFIIKTLSFFQNDGAMVFPLMNMGIILGSMFISLLFFAEKLNWKKSLGIAIAFLAIYLISYQEILTL